MIELYSYLNGNLIFIIYYHSYYTGEEIIVK
jgi:hypothetical protein